MGICAKRIILIKLLCAALPADACETALLLAMDVSNSVDESEYRLQIDSLAEALDDPEVVDIIVDGRSASALVQWSGVGRQELSLGWTRLESRAEVADFARLVRDTPRAFRLSDTAPGDALNFSVAQFATVPDCERHVIDVSGDGTPNAGADTRPARTEAQRQGITINGLAIESMGIAITGFYERAIITTDGFVITAPGHRDYARAIRVKLIRELSRIIG